MELILLHTNDTHGHLKPIPTPDGTSQGGYARRATFVQRQRAENPNTLLLDAGDFYQGSRFWHEFKGQPDIRLMNTLRYDAATIGNHDFDGGLELLARRLREARFPILCANFHVESNHILHNLWQPYVILNTHGLRVAVLGLTIDALELYPQAFREQVRITPAIETARTLLPELRRQADVVILLSHLGHLGDVALAEAVAGFDLIIGGHTHTALEQPLWVNDTPIVRGIVGNSSIGRSVLQVEPGNAARLRAYALHPLGEEIPGNAAIEAEVEQWEGQLPPERVLGHLQDALDTRSEVKGSGENRAGNFFADALLAYFAEQVDLAFVHMGTLRGDRLYGPGVFTNHDLSEYHPFDNPPILMEITAPQLKFILERGVSALPTPVGTFLSHAGLKVWVDLNQPAQQIDPNHPHLLHPGSRIVRAEFNGATIDFSDEQRTFRIVCDGYMGRGGSGYFILKHAANIRVYEYGASQALTWYLRLFSPVAVPLGGRIIIQGQTSTDTA